MRRANDCHARSKFPILRLICSTPSLRLQPDFAEAGTAAPRCISCAKDYALSISDVEQVLRLEPRHFGALSGIGIMLDELGRYRQAQVSCQAALEVSPLSDGRARAAGRH